MRMLLATVLLAATLVGATNTANAGHEGNPVLKDALPIRGGVCSVEQFRVVCELYVHPDGNFYLALYLDGKIAVIRKVNEDGSAGGVVWSIDAPKPAGTSI